MSLATWRAEFYPVTATQATSSDLRATRHCLRKWRGLLKGALRKHAMKWRGPGGGEITDKDGNEFEANDESCALCARHLYAKITCEGCPLLATMGVACQRGPSHKPDAYQQFLDTGNAVPMVRALTKTLKRLEVR